MASKGISLDDLEPAKKKKKKKLGSSIKIKSSAKAAVKTPVSTSKKAKTLSKTKKVKKNREDLSIEGINPNAIFDDLPEPTPLPTSVSQSTAIEGQLLEALANVPDSVKRENEQFQEYIALFKACQNMARAIEERFEERRSPRDVYPLMKLYEQMREIIADLRAIKDVTELGTVINDEVMSPFAENASTILIAYHQTILSWINSNCTPAQVSSAMQFLKQQLPKSAKDMEQAYHASLDKTMQIFSQEQ